MGTALGVAGIIFGTVMVAWSMKRSSREYKARMKVLQGLEERAGYLHQRLLAISELPDMWRADADGRSSVDYAAALQECADDLAADLKRPLAPEGE